MSQFRDKKIDTGVPDEWNFRTNDDGLTLGDDIVAEDPNDLARALIDTQTELLKASVYSPASLIDPNSGALERIKLLEDNVGNISLQDAYTNGNYINPTPGSNLVLGAGGVIEIDSGQNLLIKPNTMRVYSGAQQLDFTHNSITSSTTNVTIGTVSPSRNLTILGGNDLFLKDGNLIATVTLSETGVTALNTTSQSIIGAINEVSGGFTSTDLQQIYNQSAPPRITTTLAKGKFIVANGTGNPFVPALEVQGGLDVTTEVKADRVSVGPFLSPNTTLLSNGQINSNNTIASTTVVQAPEFRTAIGSLKLTDTLGTANLTSITDPALNTVKKTIFGSINEVNALSLSNASGLAAFAVQHNSSTGQHGIITTQAAAGQNATNRIAVRDDGGTDRFTVKGSGVVNAQNVLLPAYDLSAQLSLNEAHRNDDGTAHTAVAAHFTAANPHNTVKYINVDGSPNLSGEIVLLEGAGITLTQIGQNIEISAAAGSTLQGVYDTQANGNLDLAIGKELFLRDAGSQNIASFEQSQVQIYKNIQVRDGSNLSSDNDFSITAAGVLSLLSSVSDINITATGGQVVIESVPFAPIAGGALPTYTAGNLIDSHNEILDQRYWFGDTLNPFTNNTNYTIPKGTPILMRPVSQDMWTPIPSAYTTASTEEYKSVWGIVDEDVPPSGTARVKHYGLMEFNLGQMDATPDGQFQTGDILYVSKSGSAGVEFTNIASVVNGNTVTVDVGGANAVYQALSFGADPDLGQFDIAANSDLNIREQFTVENLVNALNNDVFQSSNGNLNIRAFSDGKQSRAHVTLTGTTTVGDTFTIGAGTLLAVGSNNVVLTAVAQGAKISLDEFEVGNSASHTARNLNEAILDQRVKKVGGLNGHQCYSEVNGDTITVIYQNKGKHGDSITLATTSADIIAPANLSGGQSVAKIYRLFRDANGKTLSTNNGAAIAVTNFTDDESESLYIAQRKILEDTRIKDPIEKFIKVGKIVGADLPNSIVKIDLEGPDVA